MATKIKNGSKPAENKNTLNTKQQYFIDIYTDPKSKTFGNITRSYMQAYNCKKENSAAVSGSQLLRNPKIITEYERLAAECGLSSKVRMNALSSIVSGNYRQKTVKHKYTYHDEDQADGSIKRKRKLIEVNEETKTPTAREIAHSVGIIEKIAVEHKKAGLTQLSELSEQAKQVLSTLKDVTPHEDDNTLLMIAETEILQEVEGGRGDPDA